MSRKYHHAKNAGKGSKPRPVDGAKYGANYDRIFGKKKFNGQTIKRSYPDNPDDYECIKVWGGQLWGSFACNQ